MDITTYLGTPDPKTSPFARANRQVTIEPTTGEVMGAYVAETFQGEGSLYQDIAASNIKRLDKTQASITEADWKGSENFRPGLNYYPTMSEYSAKTLAEIEDDRTNRQLVMDKASRMQTITGFGVGFLSGVAEPKNLVSGVAAALATAGVGALVPSVGRVIAVNTVKAAAARGAAEGVVGAALTEPSSIESSRIVQGDYTMADSLMNLALGSVLGAGLGAAGKALELRGAARTGYIAEPQLATKEFDTALSQITQGSPVDVSAVKQFDNIEVSNRARQELPKIEEKIATLKAETNSKIEPPVLKPVDAPDTFGQQYYIMNGDKEAGALLAKETESAIEIRRVSTAEDIQGKGFAVKAYEELAQKALSLGKELHSDIDVSAGAIRVYGALERRGYAIIKNPLATLQKDGGLSVPSIKSGPVFRVTKAPPLSDLQRLQAKKGQAEANSKIQTDYAPIKKLQDDIARPDNSTAYNAKDSAEIQKYLDEWGDLEDQAAVEAEIEMAMENLKQLQDQDLLTDADLNTIERLSKIDEELNIFDNVLQNAKLCLTGK